MKRRIAVLTDDSYLFQKIYLILTDYEYSKHDGSRRGESSLDFSRHGGFSVSRSADGAELVLLDLDAELPEVPSGLPFVRMSRGGGAELNIPFTEDELVSALTDTAGGGTARLLSLGKRCAYLRGDEIKLTEVEFSLLSVLVNAGGFVSRERLLSEVWHGEADGGVLNVYIHYLREKLEFAGEKIILSSRNQGYRIDEKYLGTEVSADA